MTRKETFNTEHLIDVQTQKSLTEKSFQVDSAPTTGDSGGATVTVEASTAGSYYVEVSRKDTGNQLEDIPFSFAEGDNLTLPISFNLPSADTDYSIIISGGVVQ